MEHLILKLPSTKKSKDWFDFVNDNLFKVDDVKVLVIDFGNIKFLDTDEFVVLACLIESFCLYGVTVKFVKKAVN